MVRCSITRSSSHLIFIVVCIYILFLLSMMTKSHSDLDTIEQPKRFVKTTVFHQAGNEVSLENTPWRIDSIEDINLITDISILQNLNGKFIFSDLGYSQGLGNLMFQLAGLTSIARNSSATLLIPSSTLLRRAFDFQKNLNSTSEISIKFVDQNVARHLSQVLEQSKITLTSCCSFHVFTRSQLFGDVDQKFVKLDGYFQNFKYFHPQSEKLMKKMFTFVDPVRKLVEEFLENVSIQLTVRNARLIESNVANDDQALEMPDEDVFSKYMIVGVHVRHGMDISMNSRNRKHGHVDTPIEYYKRAIEQLKNLYEDVAFIISSDDIAWARRYLKLGKDTAHFFCPGPREVDMAILASCDSVIISTGTFGWWSAYLNVNASPDVYYYKQWPAAGSVMEKMTNKSEYFLKNWTALE